MYYIIYKTTNLINDKYYIGAHQTDNLNDDYLGSGTVLKNAIRKYGKENFKREILEHCNSVDELYKLEAQYVTEYEINDQNCYNIKLGGHGGFDHINSYYNTLKNIKTHKKRQWAEDIINNFHKGE